MKSVSALVRCRFNAGAPDSRGIFPRPRRPCTVYVFAIVGAIAAAGDLKMILRGGLSGTARIARHLWRMSAALTIASGSFFLGQQRIMPAFMRGSPWLFAPAVAPLLLMVFWLIRVRLMTRFKRPGLQRRKTVPQFSQ